jgi:urease accessory protein
MQKLTAILDPADPAKEAGTLTLPYDLRRKARLRARLDDGLEVALLLPRGVPLRDGDRLRSEDGRLIVRVSAAKEPLSIARTDDPLLLARAAYHLGNRHVPLEIRPGRLAYQHDHVLDGLASELGLAVAFSNEPFEPERGGYAGHGHDAEHQHHHHHHHETDGDR